MASIGNILFHHTTMVVLRNATKRSWPEHWHLKIIFSINFSPFLQPHLLKKVRKSNLLNVEGSSVKAVSKNVFKVVLPKLSSKKKVSKIYHQTPSKATASKFRVKKFFFLKIWFLYIFLFALFKKKKVEKSQKNLDPKIGALNGLIVRVPKIFFQKIWF